MEILLSNLRSLCICQPASITWMSEQVKSQTKAKPCAVVDLEILEGGFQIADVVS